MADEAQQFDNFYKSSNALESFKVRPRILNQNFILLRIELYKYFFRNIV